MEHTEDFRLTGEPPSIKVSELRTVWITASFEGIHCWPEAPKEVGFLRSPHRHVFGVKVCVNVSHADRDVEFFTLKKYVQSVIFSDLFPKLQEKSSLSCEMMASLLGRVLISKGVGVSYVEVDEDGENGACVLFSLG